MMEASSIIQITGCCNIPFMPYIVNLCENIYFLLILLEVLLGFDSASV